MAYNETYPMQDIPVVHKSYSNEFHSFVLEEVLKILTLNVGMAYVVDQANIMYANLDHGGLLPLRTLDPSLVPGLWFTQHLAQQPTHPLNC